MLRLDMRIIFMGSPDFAVPSLHTLASNYNLVGVVTQPDRVAGRGKKIRLSPVKVSAQELNLPILQPKKLRDEDAVNHLRELKPDLLVVAAYGQILSQEVLDIPTFGGLNIHASLLPRWRGAAPIQAAILHGDNETGISIMLMDAGLDTGPVLSQRSVNIHEDETSGGLTSRLAPIGADLLLETIPGYVSGEIFPVPQNDDNATYAPMIRKSEGKLDFNQSAAHLARQVKAYEPWPSSFFYWNNLRIVVKRAHPFPWDKIDPGRVILVEDYPAIATSKDLLVLDQIHPAGKKEMSGEAFLRGSPEFIDAILI